jgi:hypothetical protein
MIRLWTTKIVSTSPKCARVHTDICSDNSDSSLLSEETVDEERPVTPPPKHKELKKMVMEPVTGVL